MQAACLTYQRVYFIGLGWFLYIQAFHDQQMQVLIHVHLIGFFDLFPIFLKDPYQGPVPYSFILSGNDPFSPIIQFYR